MKQFYIDVKESFLLLIWVILSAFVKLSRKVLYFCVNLLKVILLSF